MPEHLKQILDKIVEWWKKFNNKQRVIILSATAVVLIALVILGVVVANPQPKVLYACKDYAEAAEVQEILDSDETIEYSVSSDGLTFYVSEEHEADACILLGSHQFKSQSYSIDNVVTGSFTTTEADKQKL